MEAEKEEEEELFDMPRNNILLQRLIAPRRVLLPNGGRKKNQASGSLDSNMISSAIDLGRQTAGSRLGKMIMVHRLHYKSL